MFSFIEKFIGCSTDLTSYADVFNDLSHFNSQQKSTWDRLLDAAAEFKPNLSELEKDPQASAALTKMNAILQTPCPYALIKDVDSLVQQVRTVNTELINERRTKALDKVDTLIFEVERELERTETLETLGNQSLSPIQLLRTRITTESSLGNIQLYESQISELTDRAIDGIEREVQKAADIEKARLADITCKEGPNSSPQSAPEVPSKPIQYVKTSRIVKPIELMKKPFLESDQDVDDFIDTLSQQLHAAIADNARIRIR